MGMALAGIFAAEFAVRIAQIRGFGNYLRERAHASRIPNSCAGQCSE
jgi:hypothetical protein